MFAECDAVVMSDLTNKATFELGLKSSGGESHVDI